MGNHHQKTCNARNVKRFLNAREINDIIPNTEGVG